MPERLITDKHLRYLSSVDIARMVELRWADGWPLIFTVRGQSIVRHYDWDERLDAALPPTGAGHTRLPPGWAEVPVPGSPGPDE